MSTVSARTTGDEAARDAASPGLPSGARVTQGRVLVSEWVKFRSLRSTTWTLLAVVLAIVGGGAFTAVGIIVKDGAPVGDAIAADPSGGTLSGVGLAQFAVVALGTLAVTGEYRNQAIRTSLTAVPTRLPLVWGKAVVVAVVSGAASLAALLLTFVVARVVIGVEGVSVSLTTPGVTRAVLGAALVLAITGVLASAFGWLLRSTAGAVSALLALLYIVPSFAMVLPPAAAPYLPSNAAGAIFQIHPVEGLLTPWAGLAVYCGYTTLALAAAALLLHWRDA